MTDCLGKHDLYFTEAQQAVSCNGRMLFLPKFWLSHPSGNLDAVICEAHACIALGRLPKTIYINERLNARAKESK